MCRSMVDIQPAAAEIRRGEKRKIEEDRRKKPQGKNIMACPITQGSHNYLVKFKCSKLPPYLHCGVTGSLLCYVFPKLNRDIRHQPQESTTRMILFYFCTICGVQNADYATTFKILFDDKICEVYSTTASSVSASDIVTSTVTGSYCSPLYSAV